jgi:hypothetical protein
VGDICFSSVFQRKPKTYRPKRDAAVTIPANAEPGVTKEWQEAIDRLKAKPK